LNIGGSMMDLRKHMIPSQQVEALIIHSLKLHKPLSLIRINDGENRALGYERFVTKKQLPHWYRYTGVDEPNESIRRALLQSIKDADIVGFPSQDHILFRPLSEKILAYYKLRPKYICNGAVNRYLLKNGGLERIIRGRKVLLIGLTIGKVSAQLKKMGGTIVGTEKVNGFTDIPRVMRRIAAYPDYELALVSAGIPAKIICTQISKRFGKVALDMGHIPELILYPNKRYGQIMKDWLIKYATKVKVSHKHRPAPDRRPQ
jgi:hypothetical protein